MRLNSFWLFILVVCYGVWMIATLIAMFLALLKTHDIPALMIVSWLVLCGIFAYLIRKAFPLDSSHG